MNDNSNTRIQMIADFEGDASVLIQQREAGIYPTLCTRDLVVFPAVLTPIVVGRKKSQELVNMLEQNPETIFCIFCQKKEDTEDPTTEDLYEQGTFAKHAQRGAPEDRHRTGSGKMQAEKHRRIPPLPHGRRGEPTGTLAFREIGQGADVQDPDQDLLRGVNQIHQA